MVVVVDLVRITVTAARRVPGHGFPPCSCCRLLPSPRPPRAPLLLPPLLLLLLLLSLLTLIRVSLLDLVLCSLMQLRFEHAAGLLGRQALA